MTNMIAADTADDFSTAAKAVNSAAAAGKLAEADNGQMLAGIQQSSRDTVYAVYDMQKNGSIGEIALVSYNHPLTSQAEADAVEVIVFLGGKISRGSVGYNQKFTLDGFAMPGGFDVDFLGINSYPASFLRKKDGSGWIPLTRQDVVHGEWMNVLPVSYDYLPPECVYGKYSLCCGLFEHNCRGKVFYAQISDAEYWPEEQKQRTAVFYLRKDTISYDKFPNNTPCYMDTSEDDGNYTELMIAKDLQSWGSSWGELIEKFGNKTFGVRIAPDGFSLQGYAFAAE